MDVSVQTDKSRISEKQREALKKGREDHHRAAKMYKQMLSEKDVLKVVEEKHEIVPEIVPEVMKSYQISFM